MDTLYNTRVYLGVNFEGMKSMKILKCSNCGASSLFESEGYMICEYCGSKFTVESSDFPQQSMGKSLNTDIDNLIRKCRTDPANAKKYANLILDIDPTNREALKYI